MVTDTQASVDDLYGELPVRGRAAIFDAISSLKFLHELLRTHHVAGHPVAEQHEVLAARLGPKVCVEGEQTVNAVRRRAEMLGDDLGRFEGNPAEMLVDLLQRT